MSLGHCPLGEMGQKESSCDWSGLCLLGLPRMLRQVLWGSWLLREFAGFEVTRDPLK